MKIYNTLFILFVLFGLVLLLIYPKVELHFVLTQWHNNILDFFFKNITQLGNALSLLILAVITLFVSFRLTLALTLASVFSTVVVQVLKRVIFVSHLRPLAVIDTEKLHIVQGIHMHTQNSFPSGHSATAFVLFTLLAIMLKNRVAEVLFFFLALLTAFSRVYLSQHFFEDIYVGSIIGYLSAIFAVFIAQKAKNEFWDSKVFLK